MLKAYAKVRFTSIAATKVISSADTIYKVAPNTHSRIKGSNPRRIGNKSCIGRRER
jgi:hypothetical protein